MPVWEENIWKSMAIIIFIVGLMLPLIVAVLPIDNQFAGLDKHLETLCGIAIALIALTAVGIIVPHIIVVFRERKSGDWQREIGYMKQEIEALKRNQVAKS